MQRAVFGDDVDFGRLNPRNALRDAIFGDEDVRAADPRRVLTEADYEAGPAAAADAVSMTKADDRRSSPCPARTWGGRAPGRAPPSTTTTTRPESLGPVSDRSG